MHKLAPYLPTAIRLGAVAVAFVGLLVCGGDDSDPVLARRASVREVAR